MTSRVEDLVLHPLDIVMLKDDGKQLQARVSKKFSALEFVDAVILHPDLPEVLRPQRRKDKRVMVAIHVTLAQEHFISGIAILTDEQIVGAVQSGYTMKQVDYWLGLGLSKRGGITFGEEVEAETQLRIAVLGNISRVR